MTDEIKDEKKVTKVEEVEASAIEGKLDSSSEDTGSREILPDDSTEDKTSGSLFINNATTRNVQQDDLPGENCDQACTSNSSNSRLDTYIFKRRHSRSQFNIIKSSGGHPFKPKKEHFLDKEVIAEMNREYDHNLYLDRYIHEIGNEQLQTSVPKSATRSPPVDNLADNVDCCMSCTSSSSILPQSNDGTNSVSQSSESIRSSGKYTAESHDPPKVVTTPKTSTTLFATESDSGVQGSTESKNCLKNAPTELVEPKRKRGCIHNDKPVKQKAGKKHIHDYYRDKYWDMRRRYRQCARRSREFRRSKESEVEEKLNQLQQQNEALRIAIALLLKRNETLDELLVNI